jgi:hypothetical protein
VSADKLDRWISDLQIAFEDRVLVVSRAVADRWAELMVPDPLSVIDGLLAATALVHDLTLVTRNTKDVARTGANLFNPFHLPP